MEINLRDYQSDAIKLLRNSLSRGNKRPILQAPTGAGKTIIASSIIRSVQERNKRAMFTAPALSLIDQTANKFLANGITDLGVIQADHPMTNPNRKIQVCSIQTLQRRFIKKADLVMIDEAHIKFSFVSEWMKEREWLNIPFIGLSATPWTKGLGHDYDDLIIVSTIKDLIEQKYLSNFEVYSPSNINLDGVKIKAGDFHEGQLAEIMSDNKLIADIVETWKSKALNLPTLAFCVDRAHARSVRDLFNQSGIPAGYIDAYTKAKERKEIEDQLSRGDIKVVCNVGCLTTGIDWDVRAIILARPTKSEILFTQMVGRGLRPAKGKDTLVILDHADNHIRMGYVTDIHYDCLDTSKPRKPKNSYREKIKLPKVCPSCKLLKDAGIHQCPACGFAPEIQTDITSVNGELGLFIGGKPNGKKVYSKEEKQSWYSQLLFIQRDKRYAKGWLSNKYREKFGVWPSGMRDHPIPASAEVMSFIRHRNIAYAKRKAKQ